MNKVNTGREAFHPQTPQDRDAVLRELSEILSSPHFCNSKRYPALLQYIVENTLDGKTDLLKERTLGIEVFDRTPTYDTNADTVVRYTAGEVRKRLMLYYSEQGRNTNIRISLPPGSYIPEFFLVQDASEDFQSDTMAHDSALHHVRIFAAQDIEGTAAPILPSSIADVESLPSVSSNRNVSPEQIRSSIAVGRKRAWLTGAIAVLGLAAAALWWVVGYSSPQSAVQDFWKPVLKDQRAMIICTGSVVFAQNSFSGVHTAGKDIEYPFVSLQNASAIAQVTSIVERAGERMQLVAAATTPLTGLREHSITLIGGYNNQWSLRLLQPLRFHFSPDSVDAADTESSIVDRVQPQTHWERDHSIPYSSADDYALVARFRDPTTDGWVVVLAGLGRNGTEAAAEFATSPRYLQLLQERLGSGFASRNIEAVLKVKVIEGKTGAPSILAVYAW